MDRNTRLIQIAVRIETALYALQEAHREAGELVATGEDHHDVAVYNQIVQSIGPAVQAHTQICDQINIARIARQEAE